MMHREEDVGTDPICQVSPHPEPGRIVAGPGEKDRDAPPHQIGLNCMGHIEIEMFFHQAVGTDGTGVDVAPVARIRRRGRIFGLPGLRFRKAW